MTNIVIYQQTGGNVAVVIPTGELSIEEVARKDVPVGAPYFIADMADIPSDLTFFEAWEADFSQPHGYGIGPQAWFIEQYQAEIATINAEQMPARLPDSQQTIEEYDAVVAHWEAGKAARIAQLNTQIETQEAEMNA